MSTTTTKYVPLETVDCGTCRICCQGHQIVQLSPRHGDDPTRYETISSTSPAGEVTYFLKHKPNGDCIYLGDAGCTIHPNHPAMCRAFDCGKFFDGTTRAERKQMLSRGQVSEALLDAGRRRSRLRREREPDLGEMLKQAMAAHQGGDLASAEGHYRSILANHPAHADANHNLGVLYVAQGHHARALPLFKTATEANDSVVQYWLSYAATFVNLGDPSAAREAIMTARLRGHTDDRLRQLEARIGG